MYPFLTKNGHYMVQITNRAPSNKGPFSPQPSLQLRSQQGQLQNLDSKIDEVAQPIFAQSTNQIESSSSSVEKLTRDCTITSPSKIAFGQPEWNKYFGEIGEGAPLPADIDQILSSPCPFWPEKTVRDTHLLVLMPKTVNGQPLTVNLLDKLIQAPRNQGRALEKLVINHRFAGGEGDVWVVNKPYWVLMTKEAIPDSEHRWYAERRALIRAYPDYQMPLTIEAATCILANYVRSGTRLFPDRDKNSNREITSTFCEELIGRISKVQMAVGYFSPRGLQIYPKLERYIESHGIAAVRRLVNPENGPSITQRLPKIVPSLKNNPALPFIACGKALWADHFGDVGPEPQLPVNIEEILKSQCPFFRPEDILGGTTVGETHMLVLIPKTVDGHPLTINYLAKLMQTPKEGRPTCCPKAQDGIIKKESKDWDRVIKKIGDQPVAHSYWVLMTSDAIFKSQGKSDEVIRTTLLPPRGPYQLPTALEAITCLVMERLRSGDWLYPPFPQKSWMRCKEKIHNEQVVVGEFSPDGIGLASYSSAEIACSYSIGVGAVRKLYPTPPAAPPSGSVKRGLLGFFARGCSPSK